MRKALRIISVSSGIVSVVSAVILGCIYLEAIAKHIKIAKMRLTSKFHDQKIIDENYECE